MTHPTTADSKTCAEPCEGVDLTPAPAWAAAWVAWLVACLAVVALSVAVPWGWRLVLVLGVGLPGVFCLECTVLLRGDRALRRIEWTNQGRFFVLLRSRHRLPAVPCRGCQRYGSRLWILRFSTPEGVVTAVADASHLDFRAVRRLGRLLRASGGGELIPSSPKV